MGRRTSGGRKRAVVLLVAGGKREGIGPWDPTKSWLRATLNNARQWYIFPRTHAAKEPQKRAMKLRAEFVLLSDDKVPRIPAKHQPKQHNLQAAMWQHLKLKLKITWYVRKPSRWATAV